jgi:hypothetical protein
VATWARTKAGTFLHAATTASLTCALAVVLPGAASAQVCYVPASKSVGMNTITARTAAIAIP